MQELLTPAGLPVLLRTLFDCVEDKITEVRCLSSSRNLAHSASYTHWVSKTPQVLCPMLLQFGQDLPVFPYPNSITQVRRPTEHTIALSLYIPLRLLGVSGAM